MSEDVAAPKKAQRIETALRLMVTVAALIVVGIHLAFPKLSIDGVTLVLLLVALIPWLAPIIKSIEIPGVLKIELPDIERKLDEVRGAAHSAENKAIYALAQKEQQYSSGAQPLREADAGAEYERLAQAYNEIRDTQKSGSSRTENMTKVVSQMVTIAPQLKDFDVDHALESHDRGTRLSAYAYLYALPDFGKLSALVESVTKVEDRPFGQYWGIQAMYRVLNTQPRNEIDQSILNRLREFQSTLPTGSDRYYELNRVLRVYPED